MTGTQATVGSSAVRRRWRLLLLYGVLAAPLVVFGAIRALESNNNSPLDWVPPSFPARRDYDVFRRLFGPGDTVVISWDGCTLDEPRLDRLASVLRHARAFYDDTGKWYFHRVVSGREEVAALAAAKASGRGRLRAGRTAEMPAAGPRRSMPVVAVALAGQQRLLQPRFDPRRPAAEAAARRLGGNLVGPDGRTTCVVITLTKSGLAERKRLVPLIQRAVERFCGALPADQHLAGPVIDGRSVDIASQRALDRFALPSAVVVLAVCYACLGSVRAALLVFALASFCQAAALALVHFAGETMSALLIVLPPLVQVLAVAGGIHLINYYFDAARTSGLPSAPRQALRRGWLPCVLSSGTTAVGLASLLVSDVTPIRLFGAFGAASVLLTLGLLLAVIPAVLAFWPIHRREPPPPCDGQPAVAADIWSNLTAAVARYHTAIALASILLLGVAGYAARDIRTSVRIETLFAADSRILQDYTWLEENIGPLVPIELVVHCDAACPLSLQARVALQGKLTETLRNLDAVGGVISAATFLPPSATPSVVPAAYGAQVVDRRLAAAKGRFVEWDLLRERDGAQDWRLTAYVSALHGVDYGQVLAEARRAVKPVLADRDGRPLTGVSARFTGIMPLVEAIQRQLLGDLLASFLIALVIITIVMTMVQAGIGTGLMAMVGNVFPVAVLFGALGWAGVPLDIGSVMTASIALGIAVDDTLHYLTFFRRGLEQGQTRREAVLFAYRHCGAAMAQTSLCCGLGLLVFALSDFVPICRFAWMMTGLLGLALLGDLVVMPALLLSPLGRLFERAFRPPRPHDDCDRRRAARLVHLTSID